jgi:ubiquinone biosynthesis protein
VLLSLPARLSRHASVATLLLTHWHAGEHASDHDAERLADDLETLGPTFTKLGQVLSTRPDLLPAPYLIALQRLQDRVKPFSFADVESIVQSELGVRISKAFGLFEAEPIAAASLGQVHRAALRDGRLVAVKVQRPGVHERVTNDLETLGELAAFLDKHAGLDGRFNFTEMMAEFGRATLSELDYRREADHLKTLRKNLAQFAAIMIPEPVTTYVTSRVLTMDYVLGTKVTELSPLRRLDVDGEELGRELIRAYLHQVIVDGFFHADPHPGNVFLTDDQRIALLDLGMVGQVAPRLQEQLLALLIAVADRRPDEAAEVIIDIGQRRDNADELALRKGVAELVSRFQHARLADMEVGLMVLELNQVSAAHGVKPPSELTMLGKTLLSLDHVARALAPHLDVNDVMRDQIVSLMRHRMLKSVSPGAVLSTLLDAKHFAERLPGRVNRVLDSLAGNELKLKVELIDEGAVIDGLQKVANRIALGLVLAALIVAAAMIMRVPTTFTLLGYPGLATILFVLAAGGGVMLAMEIVTHDRTRRPRS